ncbi:MAG: amidohydrolase family protein [Acidimicrobiia bacterium]|nr:amidohydrolase family protein [Acidimicrobiia bacterium]
MPCGVGRRGATSDRPSDGRGSRCVCRPNAPGWIAMLFRDVEVEGRRVDVRTDGSTIAAVDARLAPASGEEVIDGRGGALLPGLHDHHVHVLAMAAADRSLHLEGAVDVSAALVAADRKLAPGAWLRAVGWGGSEDDLDRAVLDAAVPDRPVRVQHHSGVLWVLNSVALQRAGIDEPTGKLFGADVLLRQRIDDAEPLDLAGAARRLASYGVTGVTDATPFSDMGGPGLLAAGGLPQRLVLTGAPDLDVRDGPAGVEWGPAKVVLADHALPTLAEVIDSFNAARSRGRLVAVHSVTVASLVLALAAWDEIGARPGDRIEHGAVIPVDVIARIAELGLTVVTQPNFVVEREEQYRTQVDADELDSLYRCRTLLDAGVPVAFGTDAPFGDPDPWRAIAAAIDRTIAPAERVDAETALSRFLTPPLSPGCRARRVEPGERADLCLLEEPLLDALRTPSADLVAATVCDGNVRFLRSGE